MVSIAVGADMMVGGGGTAAGGTIVGCGLTLCSASPVAIAVGGAVAVEGAGMGIGGALGLAQNATMLASKVIPKIGSSGGTAAGKKFSDKVRQDALDEDPTQTCVYCRKEGAGTDLDHAQPKKNGGNATLDNAQWACPHCNRSKGARQFPKTPPAGYHGPWPPPWWNEPK